MVKAKLILIVVLIVLILIFVVQNIEIVSINFLFWSFNIQRPLLLLITVCIGFLLGVFVTLSTKKHK